MKLTKIKIILFILFVLVKGELADEVHCLTQSAKSSRTDIMGDTDKGKATFTDRLWRSADHIFRRELRHDYIDMLAKGVINARSIGVAHSRYKDALDQIGYLGEFFQTLLTYLDKNEIEQLGGYFVMFKNRFDASLVQFEKLFGKIDTNLVKTPMCMAMYNYKMHLLSNVKQGLLPGLVSILPLLGFAPRVFDHLESQPGYVENDLARMLCFRDVFVKEMETFIANKINKLADNLSDEQANQLVDIFKRTVALEYQCEVDEFNMVNQYFII